MYLYVCIQDAYTNTVKWLDVPVKLFSKISKGYCMEMTVKKAREVGEALLDAAENAIATGKTQYVKWDDDLNAAFSVETISGTREVVHVVHLV